MGAPSLRTLPHANPLFFLSPRFSLTVHEAGVESEEDADVLWLGVGERGLCLRGEGRIGEKQKGKGGGQEGDKAGGAGKEKSKAGAGE